MFNYPVEKYCIRFYKYKLLGLQDPITIEAFNRTQARQSLFAFVHHNPIYANIDVSLYQYLVLDESLSLPIFGETTKQINNVEHVWVGSLTPTEWMPLWDFKQLQND